MAPAGNFECLQAAIQGGADSVYFGIGQLNMRSHSANNFAPEDLQEVCRICRENGLRSYLTLNITLYDDDLPAMRGALQAAREAGVSAVIASDIAAITEARRLGLEVHISTQLSISNSEALRYYSQFADVVVLARELRLEQVCTIRDTIAREGICGPSGRPVQIEMFCHGALCMAISGKCYLSQSNWGRSANRGECMQLCRRRYTVQDVETGTELDIENKYIMSPRDLKTIRFIDKMIDAGVRVFKIEGRARGPEYVDTVVRCYREAIDTLTNPDEGKEVFLARLDEWDERLARVFNRGFWDGYYQGKTMMEWNDCHGSKATERKVYCGRTVRYYSKLQVAEFKIEACELCVGDEILVTGPTTGALRATVSEIRYDLKPVQTALQGQHISIPLATKVRRNDNLFIIKSITD